MDGARRPTAPERRVDAEQPAAPSIGDDGELAIAPADLTAAEKAVWCAYAPLAIEQQTLTPATAVGFRELCTQYVMTHVIADAINAPTNEVSVFARADYLKLYTKYAQRLDATLARFKLTAFGKPVDGAGKRQQPAANSWADVAK
jgi:hypothetical protein